MGGGFNSIRDIVESAASLAGNYFLPGSSLLTDHLVSKGSQGQLNSTIGKVAQAATGLSGGGVGSSLTGIPAAADIGAGYTNAANGLGGLVGDSTLGTDIGTGVSNLGNTISNNVPGLSSLLGGGANSMVPTSFPDPSGATSLGSATSPSLVNASAALTGTPSNLSSALSTGVGGGASSYGNIAALGGAANSLLANSNAQSDLEDASKKSLAQLQPYLNSGAAANSALSDALGTSGNTGAAGYGSLTKAFTPGDLTQTPGYQFDLAQGNQALDRKQAASGNYFSGASLKAAQDYGTGLADNTYNTALQNYNTQQNNTYAKLAGAAGSGLSAANSAATNYDNIGNAQANSGISSSNILNSTLSSLLSGNGAKKPTLVNGQVVYM